MGKAGSLLAKASDINLTDSFVAMAKPSQQGRQRSTWSQRAYALWKDGSWARLRDSPFAQEVLSEGQRDMVERAAIAHSFGFKGFRLQKLGEAWEKAVDAGFV